MRTRMLLLILVLGCSFVASRADETFSAPKAGIVFQKPKGWIFARTNDSPEGIILVATRYREPVPQLNPSCTLSILGPKEVGKRSAKELAKRLIKEMKADLPGFDVLYGPRQIELDGQIGYGFEGRYSVRTESGLRYDVAHRTCFLRRGKGALRLTLSGPQSGPDASEVEFEQILKSLKVNNPERQDELSSVQRQ